MAQTGFTPIITYHSTTASAVPVAGNLSPGELALNINDMKLYCENSSGVVTLLASAAGSSGDVVGPASATDTAVALFDGTTGKLLKNSAVTVGTTGNTVISGTDNSNAMLRITQLGTGNALLVEDSTNPDSTPFVVTANGRLVVGSGTASVSGPSSTTSFIQANGAAAGEASVASLRWSNDANQPFYFFAKSRSTTIGTYGSIVQSGDALGTVSFSGDDGVGPIQAATISAAVDGTPGTNDMPGRLVFATTADGASTVTERMRIDSAGNVGIGASTTAGQSVKVSKNLTGSTTPIAILNNGVIQSDATAGSIMYRTGPSVAAAAFTLPSIIHYQAIMGTVGAGATVTDQFGFLADSSLTGATNNYGFYSDIAAPTSGITTTGTITSISSSGTTVTVNHNAITYTNGQTVTVTATANATALTSGATCTILTVGTTDFTLIGAASNTVGTSFTATGAGTGDGTVTLNVQGSGKTVAGAASGSFTYTTTTSQTFAAVTVLTGTVTVSTRYNIYANGTAANYFAGSVGIGAAVPRTDLSLYKASTAPVVTLERGTTSMGTNDVYGGIEFYGNDASANANGVRARIQAIAINSSGATKISLAATGSNSTTLSDRLSVFSTGCTLSGATNITKLNERYNLFGDILQTTVDTQTDVDITADLFLGNSATYTNWMVYMPRIDVVGNYWADYSLTTATARLFKSWAQGIIYTGSAYSILGAVLSHTAYNSDATNFPAGAVNASKVLTVVSATQVLLRFQNRTSPAAASGTDWVWSLEYFNYYG